jgi:hypothetical protein
MLISMKFKISSCNHNVNSVFIFLIDFFKSLHLPNSILSFKTIVFSHFNITFASIQFIIQFMLKIIFQFWFIIFVGHKILKFNSFLILILSIFYLFSNLIKYEKNGYKVPDYSHKYVILLQSWIEFECSNIDW